MSRQGNADDWNRRSFLRTGGALALTGAVAGCTGGGGGGGDGGDGGDGGGGGGGGDGGDGGDGGGGDGGDMSLAERAEEEGTLNVATELDAYDPIESAFTDEYDIETGGYQGSNAKELATRLIQEAQTGNVRNDVYFSGNTQNFLTFNEEGMFADAHPYIEENYGDGLVYGSILPAYGSHEMVVCYNPDLISESELPTTIDELASEHAGDYYVDPRDSEFYSVFLDVYGESEAEELTRTLAEGATWVEGHTRGAQLVAQGEKSMSITYEQYAYNEQLGPSLEVHRLDDFPRIVLITYSVTLEGAEHPNAAALFMEFVAENGYELVATGDMQQAYFQSSELVNNDDIYLLGIQAYEGVDLEAHDERWRELTGITG